MSDWDLVLSLVSTIRHDGDGGSVDDLETVQGLAAWLAAAAPDAGVVADDELRVRVTALRRAVRSLFARAVAPDPPSKADATTLLPVDAALAGVNLAARALGPPALSWPDDGPARVEYAMPAAGPADRLLAVLAHAAMDFLAGPDAARLRACPAPRCVRYFLQGDPRQAWCKPSCGNRARVARHYRRHHDSV
ncbi:CGNR zinc finger domain-containing protein [Dactylosporangium sp. NPDC000521]|uniref:CGNR zinc finger domain-containing protein n=1 Tax=Dactylosporangium sp. NPDC000521 TaxID=3363975 RepID=UPI00368433CF